MNIKENKYEVGQQLMINSNILKEIPGFQDYVGKIIKPVAIEIYAEVKKAGKVLPSNFKYSYVTASGAAYNEEWLTSIADKNMLLSCKRGSVIITKEKEAFIKLNDLYLSNMFEENEVFTAEYNDDLTHKSNSRLDIDSIYIFDDNQDFINTLQKSMEEK